MRSCVLVLLAMVFVGCAGVDEGAGRVESEGSGGGAPGIRERLKRASEGFWDDELVPLGPRDFPGTTPEGPGKWTVGDWEVEADRALVERDGRGAVLRLYAEGRMKARREGLELSGRWISVDRGGAPVVADCKLGVAGRRRYQATGGLFRFEYRTDGKMRFVGAASTMGMLGS